MKCHVTFISIAKVWAYIGRPLISFCQDETVSILRIYHGAQFFDGRMRLRQILA
jgi:hypothetical protein